MEIFGCRSRPLYFHPPTYRLRLAAAGLFCYGYLSDSAMYNPDGSGIHVSWFDNGNPSSAGYLAAGYKPRGRWKYFHKNGNLSAVPWS
jgi:hypothetical protein